MLHCTVSARELIDSVMEDVGLYQGFPRATYRSLLNETIGRLYTDVVKEEGEVACIPRDGTVSLASLPLPEGIAPLQEEDVLRIRKVDEYIHYLPPARFHLATTLAGSFYTVKGGAILFAPTYSGHGMTLSYRIRPLPFHKDNEELTLPISDEFVSLIRAKLRGEILKLANEDALAAKWLAEYNAALPAFAAYCERKRRGMP